MRIRLIAVCLLVMLTLSAKAQEASIQQIFTHELTTKNEDVQSIKCRFVQIREVAILANTVKKEGDFYFRKPSRLALQFKDGDYIKMNEAWFEVKMAGKVNTMSVSANPMLRNLNSILSACITGDMKQMTKGFNVEIEQTPTEWIVEMTPQQKGSASKVSAITIHFERKSMSLNSLKMVEKSGDYTAYIFSNKEFNTAFNDSVFNISK